MGRNKIKYVTVSLLIAVYVLLSCSFKIFQMFMETHVTNHYGSHDLSNLCRLFVKITLVVVLVYGALWKKSYALLTWTCISLSLLATINMETDKRFIFNFNDVLLDSFLYFCCGKFLKNIYNTNPHN